MDGEGGSQHGDAGRAFWVNCARAEICLCILRPACVETACARAVLSVNARVGKFTMSMEAMEDRFG